jgi:hypothetical protein
LGAVRVAGRTLAVDGGVAVLTAGHAVAVGDDARSAHADAVEGSGA